MMFKVESSATKKARLSKWHKFFSLLPRRIQEDNCEHDTLVFFHYVERKGVRGPTIETWRWSYRLISESFEITP